MYYLTAAGPTAVGNSARVGTVRTVSVLHGASRRTTCCPMIRNAATSCLLMDGVTTAFALGRSALSLRQSKNGAI